MAKPILVANWKNHPSSLPEAKSLLRDLARDSQIYKKLALYIAPPTVYFESVSAKSGGMLQLASQDMPPSLKGTHTGMITPDILKSFGVRLSIIGHSERRVLGESNEDVSRKVKVALRSGIVPLVCIGETEKDNEGENFELIREQLKSSLAGVSKNDAKKLIVAYEPSWAIGKHAEDALSREDLSQSTIFIKKILSDLFGRKVAEGIPILYGGSVEPSGAKDLFNNTGVKGFLVGHASLKAKDFKIIAQSLLQK